MDIEKAKKLIKELIDGVEKYGYDFTVEESVVINKNEYKAIQTVLNELDKDNNIISDLQNEVTLKQCELDKKDKIINEMAKWIEKHAGYAIDETLYKESKEYIIDYFTKKVTKEENK